MKYLNPVKLILILLLMSSVLAGCVIEPLNLDSNQNEIKGAPDWVNRGSTFVNTKDGRMFYGVSSVSLQGDMALQKSIAEDRAIAETARILSSYLDAVSAEYMNSARPHDTAVNSEVIARQVEDAAAQQVKDALAHQIDDVIAHQFKETVSRQFKEDVARQVKEESTREIREAVTAQIEFTHQMEEMVLRQIRKTVSKQLVGTVRTHMSGAKIIGNWRDARANTIWVVAELDMKYVKNSMANINDMNNDLRKYFDQNTEIVFDRLVDERDRNYNSGWALFGPVNR
jgi:hypothetical protein